MSVDKNESQEAQIISVLRFTSLLFENTFGRSIYCSMDRLIKLLDSRKIWIVVATLRLLMVVSKCSRFITQHLNSDVRLELYGKLMAILEVYLFCKNCMRAQTSIRLIYMSFERSESNDSKIDLFLRFLYRVVAHK